MCHMLGYKMVSIGRPNLSKEAHGVSQKKKGLQSREITREDRARARHVTTQRFTIEAVSTRGRSQRIIAAKSITFLIPGKGPTVM